MNKRETTKKSPNALRQYRIPNSGTESYMEIMENLELKKLDEMLEKQLNSEEEAYENIIELQTFLNDIRDKSEKVDQKVKEKLYYIQETFGKDVLNRGLSLYQKDRELKSVYETMGYEEINKLRQKILDNPKVSEQLAYFRYHPEEAEEKYGTRINKYSAVYSRMIKEDNEHSEYSETKEDEVSIDEKKTHLLEIIDKMFLEELNEVVGRKLNSENEVYENIIDLQTLVSHPHDNLQNVEQKVKEKLYYIQETFGKDVLNRGLKLYEVDKMSKSTYSVMKFEERIKLEEEILSNPKLAEQLNYLRYHPEEKKKYDAKIIDYLAVYSKMLSETKENGNEERSEVGK